jgi:hypothetical protein
VSNIYRDRTDQWPTSGRLQRVHSVYILPGVAGHGAAVNAGAKKKPRKHGASMMSRGGLEPPTIGLKVTALGSTVRRHRPFSRAFLQIISTAGHCSPRRWPSDWPSPMPGSRGPAVARPGRIGQRCLSQGPALSRLFSRAQERPLIVIFSPQKWPKRGLLLLSGVRL